MSAKVNVINELDNLSLGEKAKYRILSLVLLNGPISGILRYVSYLLTGVAAYGTYIFMSYVLLQLCIYFFNHSKDRTSLKMVAFPLMYAAFMLMMYMLYPETKSFYREYRNDIINIFIISMPAMAVISEIADINVLLHYLKPYLRFSAIVFPILYLMGAGQYYGYMTWGTRILPLALLYAMYVEKHDTPLDTALYYVSAMFTLLAGRQAFVFLIAGIVSIAVLKQKNQRRALLIVSMIIGIFALYLFYDYFINLLQMFLNTFNIQSRSLSTLSNGSLMDASNRFTIYNYAMEIIKENGIAISGLFSDRIFLRQYASYIAYAHNLFLEMLIDFGWMWGSLLIAGFVIKTIKQFFALHYENRHFAIILFLICVARLFVSSSYLISTTFPIFLGFLINKKLIMNNSKKRKMVVFRPEMRI